MKEIVSGSVGVCYMYFTRGCAVLTQGQSTSYVCMLCLFMCAIIAHYVQSVLSVCLTGVMCLPSQQ